ncbi:MAG TPA: ABC transporter ATP-binding protein [Thermodesulfobacteriota bacterium]|nr:ABC transporter ATP-binding protein [Deltaproteobacteria bacterium]HQO78158.1 ABC transporter ATP-binding protein [Thermodesulfobacteriota bacterium]
MNKDTSYLLDIRNLKTHFFTDYGVVKAVNGIDLQLQKGQTLGIVGESGCGKSITGLSILRLIPKPPGEIVGGEIFFQGVDLLTLSEKEMRQIRGNRISMIFQEPMTSLNPVFTVGNQVSEAIQLHQHLNKKAALAKAIEVLRMVGIPRPEERVFHYPHQMSGGMRQRVMIAMAISCNPTLLIADEPTTALDVTIQAQILDLLRDLKDRLSMALMLVSHDLGVIAQMADHIAVMYAGSVMEYTSAAVLFEHSRNPYTRGLLRSLPYHQQRKTRFNVIPGQIPDPLGLPPGCPFNPRCDMVIDICRRVEPELLEVVPDQWSKCHRSHEL